MLLNRTLCIVGCLLGSVFDAAETFHIQLVAVGQVSCFTFPSNEKRQFNALRRTARTSLFMEFLMLFTRNQSSLTGNATTLPSETLATQSNYRPGTRTDANYASHKHAHYLGKGMHFLPNGFPILTRFSLQASFTPCSLFFLA